MRGKRDSPADTVGSGQHPPEADEAAPADVEALLSQADLLGPLRGNASVLPTTRASGTKLLAGRGVGENAHGQPSSPQVAPLQ